MVSNLHSTIPAINNDGTLSAIVMETVPLPPAGTLLRLWLPISYDTGAGFGRFFMARCTEDTVEERATNWSIYARRVLTCCAMPKPMLDQAGSVWDFLIPPGADLGNLWLARRKSGASLNILGPFGQSIELAPNTRSLLIMSTPRLLPLMLPVVHQMLDRDGRITFLVQGKTDDAVPLLKILPIPVEVRVIAEEQWDSELKEPLRWADQLCAALPNQDYQQLAHIIRNVRFRFDSTFAQVLVASDIVCAIGACLTCVISTRDNIFSRACIHGPVFPLTVLA